MTKDEIDAIASKVAEKVVAEAIAQRDHYTRVEREINGQTVECEICDRSENVYHRTSVRHLGQIEKDGAVKPSEAIKTVSMSASENQTFGGTVRMKFNRSDIPDLEHMCYVAPHTPDEEIYQRKREELTRQYGGGLNRADAEMGVTTNIYKEECEVFSRKPVPMDEVKEIEYWVARCPDIIEESNVSCRRVIPSYIDGSGWGGGTWDKLMEYLRTAKAVADRLGVPFKVNSCFSQVRMGWSGYINLDEDNLRRLSRGEDPIITPGRAPEVDRGNCKC